VVHFTFDAISEKYCSVSSHYGIFLNAGDKLVTRFKQTHKRRHSQYDPAILGKNAYMAKI
jgi:hypothetical protein